MATALSQGLLRNTRHSAERPQSTCFVHGTGQAGYDPHRITIESIR